MKTFFFLSMILVGNLLFGQWTPQTTVNTLVASSSSSDMKSLGTTSGKTAVVFWKSVGPPVNYELRMQVLDVNGQQLLGPDGVLVSDNMNMSTSTAIMKITTDASENIYIGATGTNTGTAYAFKLNINGVHQWGTNGIILGGGYMITIKPLASGAALIAWNSSNQILYQKFSATGAPLWPNALQVTNGSTNNKSPSDIFELANQDFVLVFHTFSFGISSTLWAQKYSSSGAPLWSNPIQLSNKTTTWNYLYSSAQDQDIVYYGYKAATGTHFDSYLQRINPDGTLPWGINGADFDVTTIRNEMDTKIAFESGSNYVWSICNYASPSQGEFGVYIQKFDKLSGARQFSDTAKAIYYIGTSRVVAGDLMLSNDQPVFLMKDGFDNGATPTTLNACFLNANGDFVWPSEFMPMATYSASKSRIHFSKNSSNSVVASFVEEKTSGLPKIYAQSQALTTATYVTQTFAACDSFVWIDNQTYLQSTNSPSITLQGVNGGDSIITLNLTITPSTYDTTFISACGSFTWNGQTYTDSGIYTGPNANCVTQVLDLNITIPTTDTIVVSACDSYLWENQLYNTSGIYTGTMVNCQTPILNLTISQSTFDTTAVSSCESYDWNGQTYNQSGIYFGTISNCVTPVLNLTIDSLSVDISASDMTLIASQSGVNTTYQWIDCASNMPIINATDQSFTATLSGLYAVILSNGICTDTSACLQVSDAGLGDIFKNDIKIFPNPSDGLLTIASDDKPIGHYQVFDLQGRLIISGNSQLQKLQLDLTALNQGSYIIRVAEQSKPIIWIRN